MRFWFGLPRIMGIRPGISFGREDFRKASYVGAKTQRAPGKQLDGGFVYVIRGDHNLVKIGVSSNPTARLAAMKTASAFPLELCFVGACQTSGIEIEREAHRLLEPHRTNGEWFDVSTELASSAIFGAAAKLGQKIASCPPNMVDTVIAYSTHPELLEKSVNQTPFINRALIWAFMAIVKIASFILVAGITFATLTIIFTTMKGS
jgi:hypothetical protein